MKVQAIWLAVLIGCLVVGCAGVDSQQSFDTEADFAALRTYDWIPGVDQSFSKPRYGDYLMNIMDKILESKGYTQTTESPDFLVQIPPSEHYKEQYATIHGPLDSYEGKLIIQILDSGSKEVIWEGISHEFFSDKHPPEETEKGIKKATEDLLAGFPPE